MRTLFLAVAVSCAVSAALGVWEEKGFDYYGIILEREPFGHSPEQTEAGAERQAVVPQQQSFARNLRLSALWKIDDVGVRAGIMDLQNKQNYTLGVGDSIEGIELVSADYEGESVVVKKGAEHAQLEMQTDEARPISARDARELNPAERLRQNSYLERRRARRDKYPRPEPKKPKYSGEELRKRLKEVQMDAIRTGKPALPIPLTPEMDKQLVKEGVLPPLEE